MKLFWVGIAGWESVGFSFDITNYFYVFPQATSFIYITCHTSSTGFLWKTGHKKKQEEE